MNVMDMMDVNTVSNAVFAVVAEWMLNILLEMIRNEKSPPLMVHLCFKFLYIISKARWCTAL